MARVHHHVEDPVWPHGQDQPHAPLRGGHGDHHHGHHHAPPPPPLGPEGGEPRRDAGGAVGRGGVAARAVEKDEEPGAE